MLNAAVTSPLYTRTPVQVENRERSLRPGERILLQLTSRWS